MRKPMRPPEATRAETVYCRVRTEDEYEDMRILDVSTSFSVRGEAHELEQVEMRRMRGRTPAMVS